MGNEGDTLIGISTSGNFKNVIEAVKAAKLKKMTTIVLTGKDGGKLAKMKSDAIISVPSQSTQYIQETHLAIEHILCELVEQSLYSGKEKK